jgi:hypothetical protein
MLPTSANIYYSVVHRQGRLVALRASVPATLPARCPAQKTVRMTDERNRERPKGDAVQAAPTHDLDADYTPRYICLARLLRGKIEDGSYPPGSLLPSSKQLASVHEVSTVTALHALEMLVRSGHARHVESKPHQVIWPGSQR